MSNDGAAASAGEAGFVAEAACESADGGTAACCVTVGDVDSTAVAVVGTPLFETIGVAASGVTPAASGPAAALLVAGADGEAVSVWVAPPWAALVPVVAAVFWSPALVTAAGVGNELADCPTGAELSADAAVPVVPAATAGVDSPLPAAGVVTAGGLPPLLADEPADWPVGSEPVIV
jgi:hypothetical protein